MGLEVACGVRDEVPFRFVVVFVEDHGVVGVVSKEGFPHFICHLFNDVEKAHSYIASVERVMKYKGYLYERREVVERR